MQEEVENKTVNLAVKTTKVSLKLLIRALIAYKRKLENKQRLKQVAKNTNTKGKQSVKETIRSASKIMLISVGIIKSNVKFIARKTGVTQVLNRGKQFVRSKVKSAVNKVTKQTAEALRSKASESVKVAKKTLSTTRNRFGATPAGKQLKHMSNSMKDSAVGRFGAKANAGFKKVARKFNNPKVKKATKAVTTGLSKTLAAPFKLVTKLFSAFNAFKKWVLIGLGIAVVTWLALLVLGFWFLSLTGGMGSDSQTSGQDTVFSEAFNSYIIYHKENKMKNDVNWLEKQFEKVMEKAEEVGNGHPINDEVLEEHHIDRYGSPDKAKGYTINFYDPNGNLLPNNSSNIKDMMAVATVIAGNYIGTDDMDEVDNSEYRKMDKLLEDVYEMMLYHDPDTGYPFDYEESDIYVCNHGCDTFEYYCNGQVNVDGMTDITRYNKYKRDGVGFYDSDLYNKITAHAYDYNGVYTAAEDLFGDTSWDSVMRIHSVTGKGCRNRIASYHQQRIYRYWDIDEIWTYDADEYDRNNWEYIYDWTHGHYDYWGNYYPPYLYESYIYTYDVEYYCPGHTARCCYGHKDIDIKVILYDVEYVINHNMYPEGVDGSAKYTEMCHKFPDMGYWGCESYAEQARKLKTGDWYDMYGILVEGAEFSTTPSLTNAQIQAILSAYGGDVSQMRKDIIAYGLDYVGKISYEFGGKASGYGPNASFGTSTGDEKGRSNGLDCSGFINYIIGSATGISVPFGTANYSNYTRKSESSLQIGDLGFIKSPGSADNHVAMYIGTNDAGRKMWLECNSGSGACITTSGSYKYFLDPLNGN